MARVTPMARGPSTRNPYTPDSGVKPPALTGRDKELEHLRSIITQVGQGGTERHVLITGLRGVGKTVLLNEDRCDSGLAFSIAPECTN